MKSSPSHASSELADPTPYNDNNSTFSTRSGALNET